VRPAHSGCHDHFHLTIHLAVRAEGLVKVFGDNRAVDGVDLAVDAGTVYGVLGPNGAGKTTTINMLATLMRPDAVAPRSSATTSRGSRTSSVS
jgi:ABC-type branched-subunit amino acid transport system ATPase component